MNKQTTFKQKNKKIQEVIRHQVIEVMREMLSDPDFGLELRQGFVKCLKKSIKSKKTGQHISLDEVLKKHYL